MSSLVIMRIANLKFTGGGTQEYIASCKEWLKHWTPDGNFKLAIAPTTEACLELCQDQLTKLFDNVEGNCLMGHKREDFTFDVCHQDVVDGVVWYPKIITKSDLTIRPAKPAPSIASEQDLKTEKDRLKNLSLTYFESVHIAIFNSTSTDTQKAKNAVLDKYGQAGYAHVEGRMKTGIMELFGHDITAETALFASVVASSADHRATLNKAREAGSEPGEASL